MAEHRPVSRYRPNIAADTSQLLHNIHGTRPEYSQVYRKSDVYEQYARPKSRRSEPMEIIERPKTSRGRRSHCADISLEESERPVSRRGHHFGVEGAERPLTRHGRTSASDENPGPRSERETQPNYGDSMRARHGRTSTEPGGVLVMGDNTKGDVLTLDRGFQPTPPPPRTSMRARPKSAKGRMRPQAVVTNTGEAPVLVNSPPPRLTSPTAATPEVAPISHVPDSRPSSQLNRFNPLPSIGRKTSVDSEISVTGTTNIWSAERDSTQRIPTSKNTQKCSDKGSSSESYKSLHSQMHQLNTEEKVPLKREAKKKQSKSRQKATAMRTGDSSSQRSQIDPVIVNVSTESEPEFHPLRRKVILPAEPSPGDEHVLLAVKLPSGQRPQRRFRPSDPLQTVMNFAELSARLDFQGCELVCDVPRHMVFSNLDLPIQKSGVQSRTVLHVRVPDADD